MTNPSDINAIKAKAEAILKKQWKSYEDYRGRVSGKSHEDFVTGFLEILGKKGCSETEKEIRNYFFINRPGETITSSFDITHSRYEDEHYDWSTPYLSLAKR